MSELKTQPTTESVSAFLDAIPDDAKRRDCQEVLQLMREVTDEPAVMWGSSIVGFGRYHYRGASGREGDWFVTGFSPRARQLTLYIMAGFDRYDELMQRLGKYTTGKSCLYLKRLDDVDRTVLRQLITESVAHMRRSYPQ